MPVELVFDFVRIEDFVNPGLESLVVPNCRVAKIESGRQFCRCHIWRADAAFDVTMDYITERKAFGQPIADFQNSRFKMASMRTEIDVAQAYIDQCVEEHNRGELTAESASKAKLFASELEGRVTDECVQLHGGAGYMKEYPICRMYLDARVSRIYAGSSEVMREIIARSLGLDPRKKRAAAIEKKASAA